MGRFVAKERKTIDAIRWDGENRAEIDEFEHDTVGPDSARGGVMWAGAGDLYVKTLHGDVLVRPGVWVAFGGTDLYPLDDGEFRRLYEPVVGLTKEGGPTYLHRDHPDPWQGNPHDGQQGDQ